MDSVTDTPVVYEYLDYRKYLQDYYAVRKNANPNFSYRTLSDKMGFKTKDFIHRVMRGERNLTQQSIPKVCLGIGFTKKEAEFFGVMVQFCQCVDSTERETHFERLQSMLKTSKFAESQHMLAHRQYMVYSEWRHLAVRSLIGMHGFNGDYDALGAMVNPSITATEAETSVRLLEECGLIEQSKTGTWTLVHKTITTGDIASRLALRGFHQKCIALGASSIDRDSSDERNISGLTIGISHKTFERIVDRINSFRKEIAQIASEERDADRVYQFELMLFPMSKSPPRK